MLPFTSISESFFDRLLKLGALLVIACRAYQFAFRPEWTEAQAFREMWRLWLAAIAVLLTALGIRWRMQR